MENSMPFGNIRCMLANVPARSLLAADDTPSILSRLDWQIRTPCHRGFVVRFFLWVPGSVAVAGISL
jgi:hypothetical protein